MNTSPTIRHRRPRHGIGLLEVIVCTGLVAIMIIPIAGVIRASSKSIERADGSISTEADLRTGLRWLGQVVRDSQIVSVRPRRIQLRLSDGTAAIVYVRRQTLWLDDGSNASSISENIRDIRFTEILQTAPPRNRIGISIAVSANHPDTGRLVTINTTVAIPPQA